MTIRAFVLAALVSVPMIGSSAADDHINLTPPLYREQARTASVVRPASELTTTPRPVPAAPASLRIVAEATDASAR